ncbi:hypothetical protein OS190_17160 [Sulfitobacter sp. F26204]|uniref:hypothetical protein n=1 Tax=Sulfitobacter sp. F26204 TaxID=2996014 RepID=UPI00225E2B64|nr:hypothetical protein [Sulfitobacter sp. F26204]MCX7561299.1 hypothetical protein [Sulfitobacter sp. F26204]
MNPEAVDEQELCEVETDEASGTGDEDFSHDGVQFIQIDFATSARQAMFDGELNALFMLPK